MFQSKIDPYSSFTINLGPLYVERVFDSLLTRQGVKDVFKMSDWERFGNYLEYLRKKANPNGRIQCAIIQFYKGHFFHRLANHSGLRQDVRHFREKALCYYQTYLELSNRSDESRYYAQWQIGVLQDILKYPWLLAEDSLHKAAALDQLRGEATKQIIEHCITYKEWDKAYHYSAIAMERFFNNNPVANRRWYIDFDAYNRNVVRRHHSICEKLSYLTEKLAFNGTLNNQAISQ